MHKILLISSAVSVLFIGISSASAASPASWAKVDKASEAACLKAAKLDNAAIGQPIRYSDRVLIDAREVTGNWPQPHMNGAKARMLCLYNRRTKRVEVQELPEQMMTPDLAMIRDVRWRAEEIGGKTPVAGAEVSFMLGSDGKIGGKSGCNGYGAKYQVDDATIKVFPPIIGTKMACESELMTQERAYQDLVQNAASIHATTDGKLKIVSANGLNIRYVRK